MARDSAKKKIRKKISIYWSKNNMNNSYFYNKILKSLVKRGRKHFVNKSISLALKSIKAWTIAPLFVFFESLEKIRPVMVLQLHRKGAQYYQVPTIINIYKQYVVGVKWMVQAIQRNSAFNLSTKITKELNSVIITGNSSALERQNLLYAVALENRAFTHYRWGL